MVHREFPVCKVCKVLPARQVPKALRALKVLKVHKDCKVLREKPGLRVPLVRKAQQVLRGRKDRKALQVLMELLSAFRVVRLQKMICLQQAIPMAMVTLCKAQVFYGFGMVMAG
jgi:hypothetical protein